MTGAFLREPDRPSRVGGRPREGPEGAGRARRLGLLPSRPRRPRRLPEGPTAPPVRNGPCRRPLPSRHLKVLLIEAGTAKEEFKRSQSLPSPGLAARSVMILINTTSFPQT